MAEAGLWMWVEFCDVWIFLKRGMHMLYESECLDICLFPPCTPYNAFLFACLRVWIISAWNQFKSRMIKIQGKKLKQVGAVKTIRDHVYIPVKSDPPVRRVLGVHHVRSTGNILYRNPCELTSISIAQYFPTRLLLMCNLPAARWRVFGVFTTQRTHK